MDEWTPEWLVDKFRDSNLGNDILIGIDEVPWQDLRHAYGAADDIPPLLRAIFSDIQKHGDFALHILFGSIWHQGTVYQATQFATPFLIQVLRNDSVLLKHRILIVQLLECMANGNSYLAVHYELDPEWYEKHFKENGTNKEEILEEELGNVKAARESVLKQKDQLLELIDLSNQELTCNIYILLGGFQEYSTELFAKFVEKYHQENHHEKKVVILEALRQLALANDDNVAFFRKVMQKEDHVELLAIAALALIETQKQAYDAIALDILMEFVRYRLDNEEKTEDMPSWKFVRDGTISIWAISKALIQLSSTENLDEFGTFVTLLKDPGTVFESVQDLFFYLHKDDRHKEISSTYSSKDGKPVRKYRKRGPVEIEITDPVEHINVEFIPILKLIVALPLFWEVESNLLNVFGLPHSKDDIVKLIKKYNANLKAT